MATEVGMPCWQGGPWLAVHAALYHMHLAPPPATHTLLRKFCRPAVLCHER